VTELEEQENLENGRIVMENQGKNEAEDLNESEISEDQEKAADSEDRDDETKSWNLRDQRSRRTLRMLTRMAICFFCSHSSFLTLSRFTPFFIQKTPYSNNSPHRNMSYPIIQGSLSINILLVTRNIIINMVM
jgi:hypothetical protein